MNQHPLNTDVSLHVYSNMETLVKEKECYNNVFRAVTEFHFLIRVKKWKIAYGYWSIIDSMYARHCFLINEHGEAVDPTFGLVHKRDSEIEKNYYSFAVLELDEYLDSVEKNNYYPDLMMPLKSYELQAFKWAKKHNMVLVG